jgi:zinc protease
MMTFPSSPPAAESPRPWALPPHAVQDLGNGLRVAAVRLDSLPIVQVRWVFGSGRVHEARDRLGSGLLLQRAMRHGTTERSLSAFADTLDGLGARMGGGVTIDSAMVSISGLNQHLWRFVDLATGVALEPALPEIAVAAERHKALQIHRHEWSKLEGITHLWLAHSLYGTHPYGLPRTTAAGLKATTRADLQALHSAIVDPHRGLVLVVGRIDVDQVVTRLASRYQDLPSQTTPTPIVPPKPLRPAHTMALVSVPGAEAVSVGFGVPAVPRSHADFNGLSVVNQIFGGHASSRLFDALRTRAALSYGAYSQLDCGRHGGDITSSVSVGIEDGVRCVEVLFDQVRRMGQADLGEAELDRAKRFIVGRFPQRANGLAGVATLHTAAWMHELPDDEWSTAQTRTSQVNLTAARELAARYFQPSASTWVVAGPPEKLGAIGNAAAALGLSVAERRMDELEALAV